MTLRYGAIVDALSSLRGELAATPPSETAVRYRAQRRRGVAPLADIYVPDRASGASVVLVHGGAFVIGSRRMKPMRYLASRLYAAGIAVCAIDYRLVFRGGGLAAATEDVVAATQFWRERTTRLGLDRQAISLVGLSAGGTLAMRAATRVAVARLACGFGLYDAGHLPAVVPWLALDGERTLVESQPAVPTLLLHGTHDGLVPVEQARAVAARREQLGLPTRLVIYEGAPHGFFNRPSHACNDGVRELVAHVGGDAAIRM
jgi:acetyl esterase/lipase